jgi:ATP-binding cassette subfamily B (MDR/TAP) protein 1
LCNFVFSFQLGGILNFWDIAGKTVALVGSSGSGKSTVIALLERFYDPLAGEVLIDSVNIKEFQLKWLRRQIGLVSQEPALFATTIKENILYGKDGATTDEVVDAAKSANAYNFIMQLPQGFDTQVNHMNPVLYVCKPAKVYQVGL